MVKDQVMSQFNHQLRDELPLIVDHVLASDVSDFKAFRVTNVVQILDRLAMNWRGRDVQINRLFSADVYHSHGCSMMSLMLEDGYWNYLRPAGCDNVIPSFFAPGSFDCEVSAMREDMDDFTPDTNVGPDGMNTEDAAKAVAVTTLVIAAIVVVAICGGLVVLVRMWLAREAA